MSSRPSLDTSVQAQAAILEQMHCCVVAADPEGTILYWNRFAEQLFQWTAAEALGRPTSILVPPHRDEGPLLRRRIHREGHLELETTFRRKDGSSFLGRSVSTVLRSPAGEVIGQISVTTDVTEQRKIEEEHRRSEERFRSLAEGAPLMIWMTDAAGQLEYVNSRVTRMTGMSAEESLGASWLDSLHPDDGPATLDAYARAIAERRELRHEFRMHDRRTESYVWVLGTAVPRFSEKGDFAGFVGYGLDIDEQKREEEARAADATIAATLADVAQELISSLNSPGFLDRLCALSAQHLQSESSHTLLLRAEDRAFELIAGTYASSEEREETLGLRVPAEMMEVLVDRLADADVSTVGTVPESFKQMDPTLAEPGRICLALRKGDELIGIQTVQRATAEPLSKTQLAIARGISHLASLALDHARLVEELEAAGRVKSDFVATMSHELRTPLHVILGYTDLLLAGEFGALTDEQSDTARRIDRRARELHDLITNTLDVSRLDSGKVRLHIEDVSIAGLLADVHLETQRQQEDVGLRLEIALPSDVPHVRSDPMKLKVVVKNLVSNALKFTQDGRVTVCARADDRGVEIAVEDTGIGIEREQLESIFEPFQQVDGSSSRRHGGAGLGLYIVRRLIDLLGGTITVESEPGEGSLFRVWLPRRPERAAA